LRAGLLCKGSGCAVTIDSVVDGQVTYSWIEDGEKRSHTKAASNFWVRYEPESLTRKTMKLSKAIEYIRQGWGGWKSPFFYKTVWDRSRLPYERLHMVAIHIAAIADAAVFLATLGAYTLELRSRVLFTLDDEFYDELKKPI
jgi:hypothetical protein